VADGHYSYHEQAVTAMAHACVGEHVFFLENTDFEMFLLSLSLFCFSFYTVYERFTTERGSATWVEYPVACERRLFLFYRSRDPKDLFRELP
jgi:hypothetical protein